MGEIPRWAADLARLEFQGNYRVVAAKDMGDVYTRNLVRQFSVSNSAAGSPNGDQHEKKVRARSPRVMSKYLRAAHHLLIQRFYVTKRNRQADRKKLTLTQTNGRGGETTARRNHPPREPTIVYEETRR